eukprot:g60562.t1
MAPWLGKAKLQAFCGGAAGMRAVSWHETMVNPSEIRTTLADAWETHGAARAIARTLRRREVSVLAELVNPVESMHVAKSVTKTFARSQVTYPRKAWPATAGLGWLLAVAGLGWLLAVAGLGWLLAVAGLGWLLAVAGLGWLLAVAGLGWLLAVACLGWLLAVAGLGWLLAVAGLGWLFLAPEIHKFEVKVEHVANSM